MGFSLMKEIAPEEQILSVKGIPNLAGLYHSRKQQEVTNVVPLGKNTKTLLQTRIPSKAMSCLERTMCQ